MIKKAEILAILFVVLGLWTGSLRAARIITVDDDGPADFNTIQAAIDDSNDGDTIIVGDGIYTGHGNRDIDFGGRAITVRSTDPNNPNIVAATVIDCNGTEAEPHRGFYFHNQEGSNSLLAGLTITNGWAFSGGGIYCEAYYFQSNNPTITNCSIYGNSAIEGGGIGCNSRSSPNIINCTISANSATSWSGGGILYGNYADCNGLISNCTISGNWAAGSGGGLYRCSGSIENSKVIGNAAGGNGGGLAGCIQVSNCIISGNAAADCGGGLQSCYSIANCIITGNTSESGGGVSHCGNISNSTIAYNKANTKGGAIFSGCGNTDFILTNSILSGNTAQQGNEVYLLTCMVAFSSPPYIQEKTSTMTANYSNIQGGHTQIHVDPNSNLIWNQSNIDTDPCFVDPGYWDPNGTPEDANDDLWIDGDYHLKSQAGRWEPNSQSWVQDALTSPCIDAGNPHSPIGLEPFPNGGIINMGAYSGTTEASKSYFGTTPCETIVAGDVNGDCIINFLDFRLMALHWCEDNNFSP